MNIYKKMTVLLLSTSVLVGCKTTLFSEHLACNDETGLTLVNQLIQDHLNQSLDQNLKRLIGDGAIKDLDPAKLKLSAKSIVFKTSDSRTEFIDPNSPKIRCAIDLSVTIPMDLIKKSDEARDKLQKISTSQQADELDLYLDQGKINLVLAYVLQPTDKKDKVLAEITNFNQLNQVVADTLTYAFLQPQIEKNLIHLKEEQKQQQFQQHRANLVQEAYTALETQNATSEAEYAAQEAYDAAYHASDE